MTVTLYNTSSEKELVDKVLTNPVTLTGTLRNECSVVNPVLNIESNSVITSNYCYITEFNRYYFIDNVTVLRNNLYQLELSVDVLMTYKTDIRNQTVTIKRQENQYNLYLPDDSFKAYNKFKVITKLFPNGFEDYSFLLAVSGSNPTNPIGEGS